MITLFLGMITLFTGEFSQYPFDQYPKPEFTKHNNWQVWDRYETEKKVHLTLEIDSFFAGGERLTIQTTVENAGGNEKNTIRLYKGSQVFQAFENECKIPGYYPSFINAFSVKSADLTGDGLTDFKIIYDYHSNGISASFRIMYFIQSKEGKFIRYSFDQMFEDKEIDTERDFDMDGDFELLHVSLQEFKGHSYWCFNILDFDEALIQNTSEKYDYPIFIQFKIRRNYLKFEGEIDKSQYLFWPNKDPCFIIDYGRMIK